MEDLHRLVEAVRRGDQGVAAEAVKQLGPFIRAAVRRQLHRRLRTRFDSLDFVQDVWKSFLAMPPDRYAFDTPQALVGLLTRIARNKVVEAFRQNFQTQKNDITREQPLDDPDGDAEAELAAPTPTPSQFAIAAEQWQWVVGRFPAGYRGVLELLRDGHSYGDVARTSGLSLSTVNRIVRRLKTLLSHGPSHDRQPTT
jgi:RNA polymerase sigma-70 factor (ECF subfamily)